MLYEWIPWVLYEGDSTRFWVYYGLVILGFVLAFITAIAQWAKPAPYGKHESSDANWGPLIPQRLGHILSDAIPGVLMFLLVFFFYGSSESRQKVNYLFLAMFVSHYVQRGILHPLIMNYRSTKVPLGITLGGFFPNCIYHFINADFVGSAVFSSNYFYDPRFIIGVVLFVVGYITNRWADWKLKSLRNTKDENVQLHIKRGREQGCTGYYIPYGGLFELVSCPNYFGELVEWIGWTVATWSLSGLVWCLFSAATFVPRARHNHKWYKEQFELYPKNRKALIPYVF